MEFIFEILFELFGEFLLALVVEATGSLFRALTGGSAVRSADSDTEGSAVPVGNLAGWPLRLLLGLLCGAASLWLFPHSFAKTLDTQLAVLIGVPVACGLSMGAIGAFKRKHQREVAAIDSFRNAFLFALMFVGVRFFFTQ